MYVVVKTLQNMSETQNETFFDETTFATPVETLTTITSHRDRFNSGLSHVLVLACIAVSLYLLTVTTIHTIWKHGKSSRNLSKNNYLCCLMNLFELLDSALLYTELLIPAGLYSKLCKVKMMAHIVLGQSSRYVMGVIFYRQASIIYTGIVQVSAFWRTKIKALLFGVAFFSLALFVTMAQVWLGGSDRMCVAGRATGPGKDMALLFYGGICVCHLASVAAVTNPILKAWLRKRKNNVGPVESRTATLRSLVLRMLASSAVIIVTDVLIIVLVSWDPDTTRLPGVVVFHFNVHFNLLALHLTHSDFKQRLFPFAALCRAPPRSSPNSSVGGAAGGTTEQQQHHNLQNPAGRSTNVFYLTPSTPTFRR